MFSSSCPDRQGVFQLFVVRAYQITKQKKVEKTIVFSISGVKSKKSIGMRSDNEFRGDSEPSPTRCYGFGREKRLKPKATEVENILAPYFVNMRCTSNRYIYMILDIIDV